VALVRVLAVCGHCAAQQEDFTTLPLWVHHASLEAAAVWGLGLPEPSDKCFPPFLCCMYIWCVVYGPRELLLRTQQRESTHLADKHLPPALPCFVLLGSTWRTSKPRYRAH
jgi:hypothetical protein